DPCLMPGEHEQRDGKESDRCRRPGEQPPRGTEDRECRQLTEPEEECEVMRRDRSDRGDRPPRERAARRLRERASAAGRGGGAENAPGRASCEKKTRWGLVATISPATRPTRCVANVRPRAYTVGTRATPARAESDLSATSPVPKSLAQTQAIA